MSGNGPAARAYGDRRFIPAVRVREIVGEAERYAAVHLRHGKTEAAACGCAPYERIGSAVPEFDEELTAAGRAQHGPVGFALTDGTWVEYGAAPDDHWGAVRHEAPGDRLSAVLWMQPGRGRALARVENGWQAESDETEARRLLSHHWAPVDGAFPGTLMLSTEVLGHVFMLLGDHAHPGQDRYISQVDGRMVSDGSVPRSDALAAVRRLAELLAARG